MDYTEYTIQILDKLGLFWDDLAYNKQIKVTYGDLILSLLNNRCIKDSSINLGITNRTLERVMPEAFRDIINIDYTNSVPWKIKLLSLINIKECRNCLQFKNIITEFSVGARSYCKVCDNIRMNKYHQTEKYKEYRNKYNKEHYLNNKHYYISKSQRRKEVIKVQTPKWANIKIIEDIYNNCPEGCHVDHIIPLQGKLVSGLHVETNMQYLTAHENIVKGNRVELAESA